VILAFFYGQSRIFFVMARDGLLPVSLASVSSRGTPVRITIFTAIIVAAIAGIFPLADIAALANAGTLAAFIAVCLAMLVMRQRDPGALRKFKTPLPWVVGTVGILGCAYLMWSLPLTTRMLFIAWFALGAVIYVSYGLRKSELRREKSDSLKYAGVVIGTVGLASIIFGLTFPELTRIVGPLGSPPATAFLFGLGFLATLVGCIFFAAGHIAEQVRANA
jgi:amino acid transporter